MGRRETNRAERQRRILRAARALIEAGGFDDLSMRALARRADVSVTTLYNLYGSKDQIRRALVHGLIDGIDEALEHVPLARPLERARAVVTVAIDAAMREGLLRSELRPDLLAAQIYDGFRRASLLWAAGLVDAGGFRVKALYALYVCLLGVATDEVRPMLLEEIRALESQLSELGRSAA